PAIDLVQLLIFAANGTMVSVLSERLHRSLRTAEAMVRDVARAQAGLHESEERLRIANEAAGVGTYDADLETGRAQLSPEMRVILGQPAHGAFTVQDYFRALHPDDAKAAARAVAAAEDPGGSGMVRAEVRVLRPDGEIRWI